MRQSGNPALQESTFLDLGTGAVVAGDSNAMTLSGTSNTGNGPTYSSPYVDYTNDLIWVGDGNSQLHKFTGVFQGMLLFSLLACDTLIHYRLRWASVRRATAKEA